MNLNDQQLQAISSNSRNILILAVPGSGKTLVLTNRAKRLLNEGISPLRILCITFTRKAAGEMKERIKKLTDDETMKKMTIGTSHSFCLSILRKWHDKIGLSETFSIYDPFDKRDILEGIIAEGKHKVSIKKMLHFYAIGESQGSYKEAVEMRNIDSKYRRRLKKFNAVDFDMILSLAVQVLNEHPEVLEYYRNRYGYIFYDEFHDVASLEDKMCRTLAIENTFVVGDPDQNVYCIKKGTEILTPEGKINIEDLEVGQRIFSNKGRKLYKDRILKKVISKPHNAIKIMTKKGRELIVTGDHLAIVKIPRNMPGYFVYLMYREGYGFRIGTTSGTQSRFDNCGFIHKRMRSEHADKIWLIDHYEQSWEAILQEELLSLKYKIPTRVFEQRRKMALPDRAHLKIFRDFGDSGLKLLKNRGYDFSFPHCCVQGEERKKRIKVNIISGTKNGNELICETAIASEIMVHHGAKKRGDYYRLRSCNSISSVLYQKSDRLLEELKNRGYYTLYEHKASIAGNGYKIMPATQLVEGMIIPTFDENKFSQDTIYKIEKIKCDTEFIDLVIEGVPHIIANGIITHNCFRGTSIEYIMKYKERHPDLETINLEYNYRSVPEICRLANNLIAHNKERADKIIKPTREAPTEASFGLYVADNGDSEVSYIEGQIKAFIEQKGYKYKDIAILTRTNSQIDKFREVLKDIPYQVISRDSFWDRSEIREIMLYLRTILNPDDDYIMERILKISHLLIDKVELQTMKSIAIEEGMSLFKSIEPTLTAKVLEVYGWEEDLKNLSVDALVEKFINKSLETQGCFLHSLKEQELKTRLENVDWLLKYKIPDFLEREEGSDLRSFLDSVVQIEATDSIKKDEDRVSLMTVHCAKGLEWPVVIIPGCEEGTFPVTRKTERDLIEEERRLFYVAVTRAKERLLFTRAEERIGFTGKARTQLPSRFLNEALWGDYLKEHLNEELGPEKFKREYLCQPPEEGEK